MRPVFHVVAALSTVLALVVYIGGLEVAVVASAPDDLHRADEAPPPVAQEISISEVAGCEGAGKTIQTPFPETPTEIQVGDIVKFQPLGSHDVTAGDPEKPTGKFKVNSGEVRCYKFSVAGTFPYHCALHPTMRGSIKVTAK